MKHLTTEQKEAKAIRHAENAYREAFLEHGLGVALARYREDVERTAGDFGGQPENVKYAAMGLPEEAGEVAGVLKKWLYHGHPFKRAKLVEELGDLLFYFCRLLNLFNISFYEVLEFNIKKRKTRYPNGFDPERSVNRKEYDPN
jgi:NTP pyrophosphatase (non-canonical NTP hydrolase)